MANESVLYLKKALTLDEVYSLAKEINEKYFLGYLNIEKFEKNQNPDDENVVVVSVQRSVEENMDFFQLFVSGPEGFYGLGVFTPDFSGCPPDYKPSPHEIPPFDSSEVKTEIYSPHYQASNFMWYVKSIFIKGILDYCNQIDAYDSGVGWYKTTDTEARGHYLKPSNDLKELQSQIKKLKKHPIHNRWFYNNFYLNKKIMDVFCLSEGNNPWNLITKRKLI